MKLPGMLHGRVARPPSFGAKLVSIDEAAMAGHLYTTGIPDPDLLVRTAGEMRVSNYLLWQISYAELHVTEVLWPDFTLAHLHGALADFACRERRFGGVAAAHGPNGA
jgi:undecaprenyl diphosphate synthase